MKDLVKIVVTVPEKDADKLRKAISDAGVGKAGDYTHCSFSVKGVGRFLPQDGAHPTIGQVGKLEEVVEERIEVTCEKDQWEDIVQIIKNNHPYEEPVIDVYPLLNSI
ncbi:hypothetical protein COY62_03250 [bacterium (Candidatus Howlettbacteria) CG_4_10_14_0_8_um_filter_40_9]|nr:MAG: hypothetical protein COY62_03250 [bacterium (Candidatus Howlettbacteria) CG_4_10_14_0_8_um_filter_40_9]